MANKHFNFDENGTERKLTKENVRDAIEEFISTSQGLPELDHEMELKNIRLSRDELMLFPSAYTHLISLDDIISREIDSNAILVCKHAADISKEVLFHVVSLHNDAQFEEFTFINANPSKWETFIKKIINEVLSQDRKVICSLTIPNDTAVPAYVFADINCLMEGGDSKHWWTAKEYEEISNYLLAELKNRRASESMQIEPSLVGGEKEHLNYSQQDISYFWTEKVRKHLSLIILIDSCDFESMKYFARYPRIVSRSYVDVYHPYNLENYISAAEKLLSIHFYDEYLTPYIPVISRVVAKIFFNHEADDFLSNNKISVFSFVATLKNTVCSMLAELNFSESQIQLQVKALEQLEMHSIITKDFLENQKINLTILPETMKTLELEKSKLEQKIGDNISSTNELEALIQRRTQSIVEATIQEEDLKNRKIIFDARAAYEKGFQVLQNMKNEDLEELRMIILPKNDQSDLLQIAEAVCAFFDRTNDWSEARKLFASRKFRERCLYFDVKNVSEEKICLLERIIGNGSIKIRSNKASTAIKGLWCWATGYVHFMRVHFLKLEGLNISDIVSARIGEQSTEDEKQKRSQYRYQLLNMLKKQEDLTKELITVKGHLALLNEIFLQKTTFIDSNPNLLNESQWMQKAFLRTSDQSLFEGTDLEDVFKDYEKSVNLLESSKRNVNTEYFDIDSILSEMKMLFEKFSLNGIKELLASKDHSKLTQSAIAAIRNFSQCSGDSDAHQLYEKLKKIDVKKFAEDYSEQYRYDENNPLFQRIAFYSIEISYRF